MKKILFILLSTISIYGQTTTGKETKFINGIRNQSSQVIADPTNLVTQGTDGTQGVVTASTYKDVLKYATASVFPLTGVAGKLYYDIATELYYTWKGATYEEFGAGGTETDPLALKIANNLSDLNNVSTARTNLGLGTLATQNGNFTDKANLASPTFTGSVVVPNGSASNEAVNKGQLDVAFQWTKTGNDIRNNNSGNVEIKAGSKMSVLNVSNTEVARIDNGGNFMGTSFRHFANNTGMFLVSNGEFLEFRTNNGNLGLPAFSFAPTYTSWTGGSGLTFTAIYSGYNISPTSGNINHTMLNLSPTINQTGGANGITRALYINPTLTSAFDFRALDITGGKIYLPPTLDTGAGTEKMLVKDSSTGQVKQLDIPIGFSTNLTTAQTPTTVTIESSSGTDATIVAVDGTNAGVVTPTQKADWDSKQTASQVQVIADAKVSDVAYDFTSWDGVTSIAPSKNALRDKFEQVDSNINGKQGLATFDPTQQTIALISDSGDIIYADTSSFPTPTELEKVKGVTGSIQTQIDGKQPLSAVLTATTASFTTADEIKLDSIATGANVGVVPNTAITGATKTKITYDAKGLVTVGADATQDDILDGSTNRSYTNAEKTKLAGIATGATANSSDATLLARANHTGTQLSTTISDFNTATEARIILAKPLLVTLASDFPSTSVTRVDVTGMSFSVTAGKKYQIEIIGDYQTAVTTTGGSLGFVLTSGVGTIKGSVTMAISQSVVATDLSTTIRAINATNTTAGSFITSTGVSVINSPHYIDANLIFNCTTSGVFQLQWATEVATSSAQLNAGTVMIVTTLN